MFNLFSKEKKESLERGLRKTSEGFFARLTRALAGKAKVDDEVLDDLEEILIASDVGTDTTLKIIARIQDRVAREKYMNAADLDRILKEEIAALLSDGKSFVESGELNRPPGPWVILVVGVNGVGKTTTIGKLATQFKAAGRSVLLGAADTFRAAAVDQLKRWGERTGVPVVSKGMNADPASVAYETLQTGLKDSVDVVLVDTAGRLHTKVNLMNELSRIRNVMRKVIPDAPHEVLLVLDGSTGQNAVLQATAFTRATDVTGIAVTKLDGTAKGGVVLGISDLFKVPVKYIGVGERPEDLLPFDRTAFVESLFARS